MQKETHSRPLIDDHLNPSVFSAACRYIIAGDWIILAMTSSREVGYTAISQSLSCAIRTGIRKFFIGWELLLQRTFDGYIVGIIDYMHLLLRKPFEDTAHSLQGIGSCRLELIFP